MRNLYFRLGALLVLATTAACSPSIEEVQKQVRADLEKTYKSTNLKVASLALKCGGAGGAGAFSKLRIQLYV